MTDSTATLIQTPDMAPHEGALAELATEAGLAVVIDVPTQERAETLLQTVEAKRKAALSVIKEPKEAAHKLHKFFTTLEAGINQRADRVRQMIEPKLLAYESEQRRIADEKARALAEEQRKKDEAAQIEEAILAEQAGQPAIADMILEQPVIAPKVKVAPAVADNRSATQTRYSAELTDLQALIRFVAANPKWINLIEPSMPALNRLAVAQKELLEIPGVKVVKTESKLVRIK